MKGNGELVMKKGRFWRILKIIGESLIAICCIAYAVILCVKGQPNTPLREVQTHQITENWVYENDGKKENITLPKRFNTVSKDTYTLSHVLTEEDLIQSIYFKTVHSEVRVFIDSAESEPIYQCGTEEKTISVGEQDAWHIVDLQDAYLGKTLILEITPSYTSNNNVDFIVTAGNHASLIIAIDYNTIWSIIPAFGILIIAIICLLVFGASYRKHRDVSSLAMFATSLILFCCWCLTSTALPQLFLRRADFYDKFGTICLLLSLCLLSLGVVYEYRERLLDSKKKSAKVIMKLSLIISHLTIVNLILQIILQVTRVADFFQLIPLSFGIGIAIFLVLLITSVYLYNQDKTTANLFRLMVNSVAFFGLSICYIVAIIHFVDEIYIAIKWLVFAYSLGTLERLIVSLFQVKESNVQLSTELSNAKQTIMINQIKPHFLYNALTAIKSMCAIDPKKAEESIVDFSTYLRSNISPLSQKPYIFFAQELNHIQSYLKIEILRFGEEKLKTVYDVKEKDFMVAPLTIEVLVENAVRHGLFKKVKGGTVTISSWSDDKYYYVSVKDDGVGFDLDILNVQNDSIGIKNVRYRLQTLCQATIKFDSVIGEGTVVTVTFPKSINQEAAKQYGLED